MPIAHGFIKCDSTRLTGSFDVEGDLHHLSVDVKPPNQAFECSNAQLTYGNIEQLIGPCVWSGALTKTRLQMKLGAGVFIAGSLDTRRSSSVLLRGTGSWNTGAAPTLDQSSSVNLLPVNDSNNSSENHVQSALNTLDVIYDEAKLARERQLLESGDPIIAYATTYVCPLHMIFTYLQYLWTVWRWKVNCKLGRLVPLVTADLPSPCDPVHQPHHVRETEGWKGNPLVHQRD